MASFTDNQQKPRTGAATGVAAELGAQRTERRFTFQRDGRSPIIFSPDYDLRLDLTTPPRNLPIDFNRRGRAFEICKRILDLRSDQIVTPREASEDELLLVHTPEHLRGIRDPRIVARVLGIPELATRTPEFIEQRVLAPLRVATGGTVAGAELALSHGWAFNFSGGFHHACAERAEGLCFYADTAIAVRKLWQTYPKLNVLLVDLDAHGMNGPWELLGHDPRITMVDIFNRDTYPANGLGGARPYPRPPAGVSAKPQMHFSEFLFPVPSGISDSAYLAVLWKALPAALERLSPPALMICHLGQDPFQGDKLGRMSLTEDGILRRDAFVFEQALKHQIPILTLLAGGYSLHAANLIARSFLNILHLYSDAPLGPSRQA